METSIIKTGTKKSETVKWILDPSHSELSFKVKHLMISNVKGEFRNFTAEIIGEDFVTSPIKAVIDASSIFTNDDSRDGHLRSADFFDTDVHKEILFESTSLNQLNDHSYKMVGQLTIKGIKNSVSLDVEFGGTGVDPYGNEKAGFVVSGSISRSKWGLNWNAALEAGGVLVSDEVRIHAEIQLVKKTE